MDTPHIIESDDAPLSADIGDFVEIPDGMRWDCLMCGSCCGNVFSRTWIDVQLSEYIGSPVDGFCKYLGRNNGVEKTCRIYETRPNICRGYPFIIKRKDEHYVLTIHIKCPGIGHGDEIKIKNRLMETLRLVEEDLGVEFIVRGNGSNDFILYKVR